MVILMAVMGVMLIGGTALTLMWSNIGYAPWNLASDAGGDVLPSGDVDVPPVRVVATGYLRGVAVAIVGGFWAGALVTGPAVRLIMRLLAVTAGDDAQGRLTEADEVVGNIDVGGTIGLIVFGGVLTGLLSGAVYMLVRRWLPTGWLGGVTFGLLHLVVAATVIDPLRPDNPDFDLVGPGWLSVTTFGAACVLHGLAVMAFANRYSHLVPPAASRSDSTAWVVPILLLVLPSMILVLSGVGIAATVVGLVITLVLSRSATVLRLARSRGVLVAGRVVLVALALVLLPRVIADLQDVINRPTAAAGS